MKPYSMNNVPVTLTRGQERIHLIVSGLVWPSTGGTLETPPEGAEASVDRVVSDRPVDLTDQEYDSVGESLIEAYYKQIED